MDRTIPYFENRSPLGPHTTTLRGRGPTLATNPRPLVINCLHTNPTWASVRPSLPLRVSRLMKKFHLGPLPGSRPFRVFVLTWVCRAVGSGGDGVSVTAETAAPGRPPPVVRGTGYSSPDEGSTQSSPDRVGVGESPLPSCLSFCVVCTGAYIESNTQFGYVTFQQRQGKKKKIGFIYLV